MTQEATGADAPGTVAMHEAAAAAPAADAASPHPESPTAGPSPRLGDWLREGVRVAFFRRPAIDGGWQPTPAQFASLVTFTMVLELGLTRLEVIGPAHFDLRGLLAQWWSFGATLLLAWWLLGNTPSASARPGGLASWLMLGFGAALPILVVSEVLAIARSHEVLPAVLDTSPWAAWAIFLGLIGWGVAVNVFLGRVFGLDRSRLAILFAFTVALSGMSVWQFQDRPWYPERPEREDDSPRLSLSQEVFERQQALFATAVDQLQPQRPGVVDVYGIVFAPYAQDVFLRESTMVGDLLAKRFDAAGRVLQMVNDPTTTDRLPWATPLNLQRAIDAVAARMDRQEDVLVVYMTSHGGSDFKLAASHWPLQVGELEAKNLRQALDQAGIKHRVLAISACYSGGWVGPLASDDTLVMTAADAEHTSYGCGSRSPLTFFGRAVFDEQLRSTHSFEKAFAAAVPVIRQREIEGHKADGFSNPQISVGASIRPVLDGLAQRLDDAGGAAK